MIAFLGFRLLAVNETSWKSRDNVSCLKKSCTLFFQLRPKNYSSSQIWMRGHESAFWKKGLFFGGEQVAKFWQRSRDKFLKGVGNLACAFKLFQYTASYTQTSI